MRKPLILEVDDEEDIRQTVKNVLEDEGYKVITAKNGRDCLTKIDKNKPDLILLDILMPGITTKEILTEFKKRKLKTPIIFLTVVKLSEGSIETMINGWASDYILKPFDNKDLVKSVERILEK
jgi:DNA-binding response OmpR family regulator